MFEFLVDEEFLVIEARHGVLPPIPVRGGSLWCGGGRLQPAPPPPATGAPVHSGQKNVRVNALTCRSSALLTPCSAPKCQALRKLPCRLSNHRETVKGAHRMRRKLAIALAVATLLGSAPLLSACYTARVPARKFKAAGRGLSNAADRSHPLRTVIHTRHGACTGGCRVVHAPYHNPYHRIARRVADLAV